MGSQHMDLEKTHAQVESEARQALTENLAALVLYGSHARGEALKTSDINLFMLVNDSSPAALHPLMRLIPPWLKLHVSAPVIFEKVQLQRSHDTFALELTEMAASHRTIWGPDPFAGFQPDWNAVRAELEHESRQKTIYLKRRWLTANDKEAALRALLAETVPGYLALLRGQILYSRRELVTLTFEEIVRGMSTCPWFRADLWPRLRSAARELEKIPSTELPRLVIDYLEQARAFVRHVDAGPDGKDAARPVA